MNALTSSHASDFDGAVINFVIKPEINPLTANVPII